MGFKFLGMHFGREAERAGEDLKQKMAEHAANAKIDEGGAGNQADEVSIGRRETSEAQFFLQGDTAHMALKNAWENTGSLDGVDASSSQKLDFIERSLEQSDSKIAQLSEGPTDEPKKTAVMLSKLTEERSRLELLAQQYKLPTAKQK